MNLNSIGLAAACSLLCVAFCNPSEARSVRADESIGSGWDNGTPLPVSSTFPIPIGGLTLSPGVSGTLSPYVISYQPSLRTDLGQLTDVSFQDGANGLFITSPSSLYNWYASPPKTVQDSPKDQIAVYTLADNSLNPNNALTGQPSLANDIEVEFTYNDTTTASFTIGGYKYTSTSPIPDADFLFTSSGGFVGSLFDDSSGVSLVSGNGALGGWTQTPLGSVSAPEIDPSSALGALTFLGGVLVVLRSRGRLRASSTIA